MGTNWRSEPFCSDPRAAQAQRGIMTPVEYRQFSADCARWACTTKDANQRGILISLTSFWENAARLSEQRTVYEIHEASRLQRPQGEDNNVH